MNGLERTVVLGGCRTPFQRAGTGFRDLMSYQLAAVAVRGALARTGVAAAAVDRVILGATVGDAVASPGRHGGLPLRRNGTTSARG